MDEPLVPARRWDETAATLVSYMLEHKVRVVPEDVLGPFHRDADRMVAENVLVKSPEGYAFFHEGFFDYLVAERFLSGEQSLLEATLTSDQALEFRALVRQVLQTQRDRAFGRYVESLHGLLSHGDIRFHIKDAALGVLAEVSDPTVEEWSLVAPLLEEPSHEGHGRAWRIATKPAWFDLMDSLGIVAQWRDASDERSRDLAISLLRAVDQSRPHRVASLARDKLRVSETWDRRLHWLLAWSDLSADPGLLDIALYLLERGLNDTHDASLDVRELFSSAHRLPEENPAGGVALIEAVVLRARRLAERRGETNPFSFTGGVLREDDAEQLLVRTAQAAPVGFVERILPIVLQLAKSNQSANYKPYRDAIWGYRHIERSHNFEDQLLEGLITALNALAKDDAPEFSVAERSLTELRESETALLLLYRAWRSAPVQYADRALQFISEDEDRLAVGYMDQNYWETEQLIADAVPHANQAVIAALESFLLGFYSWWERHPEGVRQAGLAQGGLLSAIPQERRSARVVQRLAELGRKFGTEELRRAPQPILVGYVRSPIDAPEAEQLDDEAWLSAIAEFDDDVDRDFDDGFRGGAAELAQVLEAKTKQQPERFAALVQRIPDDANGAYFDAVLRGLAATENSVAADGVFNAVRRCHALPHRPCGRWIGGPVSRRANDDVPADVVAIVAWYMTADPDPRADFWQSVEPAPNYSGDPYLAGINSARGAAAQEIAAILWNNPQHLDNLRPAIERVVVDPTIAVRTSAATILLSVYRDAPQYAVELFRRLAETADDLLAANSVERFVQMATRSHLVAMRPVLRRMASSSLENVRQAGGRQIALAALEQAEAADLLDEALAADPPVRRGLAQVLAFNVSHAPVRKGCVGALVQLFEDPDREVQREAATCFGRFERDELGDYRELVEAFIASPAFTGSSDALVQALRETHADMTSEIISAGTAFVSALKTDSALSNSRVRATTLSTLIIRAYRRAKAPEQRERALDVIDSLLKTEIYGIEGALEQYESR